MQSTSLLQSLYEEKDRFQHLFSLIAGELSSRFFGQLKSSDQTDALQQVLDISRTALAAEKCALFLVDIAKRSLILERASGAVQFSKLKDVGTYNIGEYDRTFLVPV